MAVANRVQLQWPNRRADKESSRRADVDADIDAWTLIEDTNRGRGSVELAEMDTFAQLTVLFDARQGKRARTGGDCTCSQRQLHARLACRIQQLPGCVSVGVPLFS